MIPVLIVILQVLIFIVLFALALILTFLLALIVVPFWVSAAFAYDEDYQGRVRVRWLWGILGIEFVFSPKQKSVAPELFGLRILTHVIEPPSPAKKKEKAQQKSEKKAKKKEEKKQRRAPVGERLEKARSGVQGISLGALREVLAFLTALFSSLKIRLSGQIRVGLSDPSDTGLLMGLCYAIGGILRRADLPIYPDWQDPGIKGTGSFRGRIWLGLILVIAVRTMFSRSIRRIWWPYVKEKLNFFGKMRPQSVEQ